MAINAVSLGAAGASRRGGAAMGAAGAATGCAGAAAIGGDDGCASCSGDADHARQNKATAAAPTINMKAVAAATNLI
ncbi:MAG TPA: hypothetical protein VIQ54_05085 [Polyangia bacterium]